MSLQFHNQLSKKVDAFQPLHQGRVTLYTCGPTVYNYLTVGNWTAYVYWDTLVRVLQANDYRVDRVMNITDVGHLVSDADDGEDKLEKGAKRDGKTAWEVAKFYTDDFLAGMKALNLIVPTHIPHATEYIPQMLELVRTLKNKGYTYQIDDGIYYDTAKFPTYGDFADLDLDAQKAGARVEFNPEKRNPSDFALWKFTPKGETRDMEWETPSDLLNRVSATKSDETSAARESEGANSPIDSRREAVSSDFGGTVPSSSKVMGFPGWHLECSAMAMTLLGETIDIHTGGIDHIPVHHTNEIAQSEAASGVTFANYWLHNNHLKVDGTKISKSLGNGYTLQDLEEKGFSPLDLRLFILQSHYRTEGNFTFDNLAAARNRRLNWRNTAALRHQMHDTLQPDNIVETESRSVSLYAASQALIETLSDDLNTPAGMAIIDEAFDTIRSTPVRDIHQHAFITFLERVDELLGLKLLETTPDITDEQKRLILERTRARENKDYQASDTLRSQLEKSGITVRDTASGPVWEYTA
ncbi:MAG TPA: cysteine--tRNA ligase [Dongiaceae bacterium]|nr:cysteine--tRNA ligase [Dongiaceae bacterium]